MRRFVILLSVLALALTGCARLTPAGAAAARADAALAKADKLIAAKQYDEAVDACIDAASKAEGVAREAALDKAASATLRKIRKEPLPAQLAALEALAKRCPTGMLPLAAHNWLCEKLDTEARAVVTAAKATQAAGQAALEAGTSSAEAAKAKEAAEEDAKASAGGKRKRSSRTPAGPQPSPQPVSAPASASVEPTYTVPDGEELKSAAALLPGLGQPDEMKALYESLGVLCGAIRESDKARAAYVAPDSVYAHRRALREANRTLATALGAVQRRLPSAD